MNDHPRHPDSDDPAGVGYERHSAPDTSWRTYAFVAVGVLLVLGFVLLHLMGVMGPGAH